MQITEPNEVFPTWHRAQLELERHSRESPLSPHVLRTTGFLRPELAERVAEWFVAAPAPPTDAVRRSYQALERETVRMFEVTQHCLGIRVSTAEDDPYDSAAGLCTELREYGSMTLVRDAPHPLLGDVFDQLRVVHDVFGHAALGVGFDLQSEFATWLQCRTLFSAAARPAAFCELVGAVTAYVMTGERQPLQAKVPPPEFLAQ